jgi:hypothetical protein
MAIMGLEPPRMTPVIMPGRETRPTVAMLATVGARGGGDGVAEVGADGFGAAGAAGEAAEIVAVGLRMES